MEITGDTRLVGHGCAGGQPRVDPWGHTNGLRVNKGPVLGSQLQAGAEGQESWEGPFQCCDSSWT